MAMQNPFERRPTESWSWFWQAFTGIGLVALVGLHMIAHHFAVKGGIRDYADVVDYLRHPIIVASEFLLLVAVTSHALLGVRAIVFDLGLRERAERWIDRALAALGVLTVGYGMWLTWVITRT